MKNHWNPTTALLLVVAMIMIAFGGGVGTAQASGDVELVKVEPVDRLEVLSGTVEFEVDELVLGAEQWEAQVKVTRTGGSAGELRFGFYTADGTAVADIDYNRWEWRPDNSVFKDGQNETKTFHIMLGYNRPPGADKFFTVHLTASDPSVLGSRVSSTVILRPIAPPEKPFFVDSNVIEDFVFQAKPALSVGANSRQATAPSAMSADISMR